MRAQFTWTAAALAALICPAAGLAGTAHDTAADPAYSGGWDDGANGGAGFGPWSLSFDGDAGALSPVYGSDPHFVDGVGVGPLGANLLGAPAFGLTTDGSTAASVEATRDFTMPLQVGQTFSVEIDGSALEGSARIGNRFELIGLDGVPRYTLRTSLGGSDDQWTLNGTNTAIEAGDAFRVRLTLTGPDTYSGSVSSLTSPVGTFSLNAPLGGTAGEAIGGLRFTAIGTGSSSDGARELFFNNLRVEGVPEPATAGLLATTLLAFAVNRRR